jgi:hypothetical protein
MVLISIKRDYTQIAAALDLVQQLFYTVIIMVQAMS